MSVPMQKFREAVFQMLYSYDMGDTEDTDLVRLLMQELAITKKVACQAQERAQQVREKLHEVDKIIADTSQSYEFERIQIVERNILRLGFYELLYDSSIPSKVAIAEALRLTKKFSTKQASAFVNAILDVHHRKLLGQQPDIAQVERYAQELAESERHIHEAAVSPKKEPRNDPEKE